MITVPEGTKQIIERSRYLSEAISKGIINHSSLARYIKPELEAMLIKKVSTSSIIMALKRLEKNIKPKSKIGSFFDHPPEMVTRSGLYLITIQRTNQTENAVSKLFLNRIKGSITSITIGTTEITLSATHLILEPIENYFPKESILSKISQVSQISITLPEKALNTPGVYYFFLKSIAWEGLNILGCAATKTEFTLFFEDKNVSRAFEILNTLFVNHLPPSA